MKRARSARFILGRLPAGLLGLLLVYHSILLRGLKILCRLQAEARSISARCCAFGCGAMLAWLLPARCFMGVRWFWTLAWLPLVVAAVLAGDGGQGSAAGCGPPVAEVRPLEETFYGNKVVDKYRWLEDSTSPETRKWVAEEMAYTRAVLDPLPGREAIHKRLTELLRIGDIGVPRIGGKYYFYTRRDGMQNQPVLYVREGIDGKDRVLVDVNQLAADGTVALDWFGLLSAENILPMGLLRAGRR